jgi:hypothetical protein
MEPALMMRRLFMYTPRGEDGKYLVYAPFVPFYYLDQSLKRQAKGQPFDHTHD